VPAIPGAGLAGFGILPTNYGLRRDGVIGGLYAGYNWQTGQTVFGIEGDISFLDGRGSSTQALFDTFNGAPTIDGSTVQVTANNRWLASIRGRVGYAWDRVMVYATGGAAFTETRYNINLVTTPSSFNGVPSSSIGFSQDKVGYAAGLGVEWMIAANWIARLEYLHYGFGGSTGSLPVVGSNCTVALNCRLAASTSDLNIDTVRVGLSYKFGGPVVAKY
jgi:outer membrane immunogenic protein